MNFTELDLSPKVLAAVEAAGYETPTPIQAQAIPVAVSGRDVLGIAQTGTGKTASFVLPMLTRLERGRARARMPRSLIIAPTRELAAQVAESFEQYGAGHKISLALLIGGVSFDEQFRKLDRGVDVLIATPGRLLDHFGRGKLLLTAVEILVIDEADRMLDMGFIPDIERICKLLPPRRQTLFFSATMPPEIQRLVKSFLKDPVRIEVAPQSTVVGTITQRFHFCSGDPREKRQALRDMIRAQKDIKNAIIFCNRKRDVAIILKSLAKHKFDVAALHGDMDQRSRTQTLDSFRNGEVTFLAASDVAARGLDIPEVSHIFNYDVPVQAEDYVHRIGRTGRAGRQGFALTLVTSDDGKVFREIEAFSDRPAEWIGEAPGDDDFDTRRGRRGRGRAGPAKSSHPTKGGKRPGTGRRSPPKRVADADDSAAKERTTKPAAERDGGRKKAPEASRTEARAKTRARPKQPAAGCGPQPRPRRAKEDREKAVVGLGDHVPDFLKRPDSSES